MPHTNTCTVAIGLLLLILPGCEPSKSQMPPFKRLTIDNFGDYKVACGYNPLDGDKSCSWTVQHEPNGDSARPKNHDISLILEIKADKNAVRTSIFCEIDSKRYNVSGKILINYDTSISLRPSDSYLKFMDPLQGDEAFKRVVMAESVSFGSDCGTDQTYYYSYKTSPNWADVIKTYSTTAETSPRHPYGLEALSK